MVKEKVDTKMEENYEDEWEDDEEEENIDDLEEAETSPLVKGALPGQSTRKAPVQQQRRDVPRVVKSESQFKPFVQQEMVGIMNTEDNTVMDDLTWRTWVSNKLVEILNTIGRI